jgi:hypothetical protein
MAQSEVPTSFQWIKVVYAEFRASYTPGAAKPTRAWLPSHNDFVASIH